MKDRNRKRNPVVGVILGILSIALVLAGILLHILYRGYPVYMYTGLALIILGVYTEYDSIRLFRAKRAENISRLTANEDLWEDWQKKKRRVK